MISTLGSLRILGKIYRSKFGQQCLVVLVNLVYYFSRSARSIIRLMFFKSIHIFSILLLGQQGGFSYRKERSAGDVYGFEGLS